MSESKMTSAQIGGRPVRDLVSSMAWALSCIERADRPYVRRRLTGVVALLLLGRLLQVIGAGLIAIAFMRATQTDGGSARSLALMLLGASAGLVGGAFATYLGSRQLTRIAVREEHVWAERVLETALDNPWRQESTADPLLLATGGARYVGRLLIEMGNTLGPTITLLLLMVVMVAIAPLPTVVVIVVAITTWQVHRRVIVRGAETMYALPVSTKSNAGEKKSLLSASSVLTFPELDTTQAAAAATTGDAGRDALRDYEERLRVPQRSMVASGVQIAVITTGAILVFALFNPGAELTPGSALIYFFSLQFAGGSLSQVSKAMANLAIFETQTRPVLEFVALHMDSDLMPEYRIRRGIHAVGGVSKLSVGTAHRVLAQANTSAPDAAIIKGIRVAVCASELDVGSPGTDILIEALTRVAHSGDTLESVSGLPRDERLTRLVAALAATKPDVLVLPVATWAELSEDLRERLMRTSDEHPLIITGPSIESIRKHVPEGAWAWELPHGRQPDNALARAR